VKRALGAAALFWLCAGAALAAEPIATFTHASFRVDAPSAPGRARAAAWRELALPDRWDEHSPAASGIGSYRFRWRLDARPRERQAVYLEHASMNAAVYVNGEWIGDGGRMTPPVAQNWNRPLLFDFSPRLLRAGENEILVRLYRLPDCYGGLGSVRAGALSALEPLQRVRFAWQIEATRAASTLAGIVALAMAVLWLGARDATYGWFGAVAALLGVQGLSYHVRDIPIGSQAWESIGGVAGLLAAPAFVAFAHRLAAWRRPRLERLAALYALATLALFVLPHPAFHTWFNALAVGAALMALYAFAPVYAYARRTHPALVVLHVALAASILALLGRDVGIQLGWVVQPTLHGMPLVAPLLIAGLAGPLLLRFARAFRDAETARAQLAERVLEKHAELEASFARLREAERASAVATERERLMRDMHDGVGSSLVRALALAEPRAGGASPAVAEALRVALEDMRIALDSLDPGMRDLDGILAALRDRLAPRLERSGVRLAWEVSDVAPLAFGAEAALDVLRICQEAIANAIAHARPSRIQVVTRETARGDRRGVSVAIEDDGLGFTAGALEGRGLTNMRARAERVGAVLTISSSPAGTRVELWLPRGAG
jgi:signal transduction histidine kinase